MTEDNRTMRVGLRQAYLPKPTRLTSSKFLNREDPTVIAMHRQRRLHTCAAPAHMKAA